MNELIVGSICLVVGIMIPLMRDAWVKAYGKEVKEEKQQAQLEARIMEEYQPRHRLGDEDVTYISQPRWASTTRWRP